jgi:hypothetical protein
MVMTTVMIGNKEITVADEQVPMIEANIAALTAGKEPRPDVESMPEDPQDGARRWKAMSIPCPVCDGKLNVLTNMAFGCRDGDPVFCAKCAREGRAEVKEDGAIVAMMEGGPEDCEKPTNEGVEIPTPPRNVGMEMVLLDQFRDNRTIGTLRKDCRFCGTKVGDKNLVAEVKYLQDSDSYQVKIRCLNCGAVAPLETWEG